MLLRENAKKEETLEPAIATFVFCAGEIFGRQEGEVDGALPEDARDEEGQALEASDIEIEKRIELMVEMVIKHPDFGRRFALQAFS